MSHFSLGYTKWRRSCASPDYTDLQSNFPQTLFRMEFTFSIRSTSYTSKYQSNINSADIFQQVCMTFFIGSNCKTRPFLSRTHSRLPDCLMSPLEAATGKGGNHSWQPTRQSRQPRTTVYNLFRVQYLPTAPNQYPKYNPRCTITTYVLLRLFFGLKAVVLKGK